MLKKPNKKRFNLYKIIEKCKLTYSDRRLVIAWRPGCGQGEEERLDDKSGMRTFGGGAGFVVLIVVMVS